MDPLHVQHKSDSYEDLQRLIAWMENKDQTQNNSQETQALQQAESSSHLQQFEALPKYPAVIHQIEDDTMHPEHNCTNLSQAIEPEKSKITVKSWHEWINSQVVDLNALRDVLAKAGYSTTTHIYLDTVLSRIRSLNATVGSLIETAHIAQNLQHPVMQIAEHPELIRYKILQILTQLFTRGGLNPALSDQIRTANGDAEKIVQVIIEDNMRPKISKKRNRASFKKLANI